jgi:CobQ-like glutamine amidotransferase family enzyme
MMELRIAHLYPDLLNIYGDRGNILSLYRRCEWRGIQVVLRLLDVEETVDPDYFDLYFMGGGQDAQQIRVCHDLQTVKAEALRQAVANQAVFLTICGGYQLLGHYYKPHQGEELRGLSLIDAYTVAGSKRMIGNVLIRRPDQSTVVGFENHSGQTFLGPEVAPLGQVLAGNGNNGQDGQEGAVFGNLYGTYLHGSLLPKNPQLADELIIKALNRRYGVVTLDPIADHLENRAHQRVMQMVGAK